MLDYVTNRIKACRSVRVARDVLRIESGLYHRIYYIRDDAGKPASWLYLTRRRGWQAWEVGQIWTFPEHRGKKHAERLYKAAINNDLLLLASGNLHTQYSQAMWRSFIRRGLFNIWAQDFRNLESAAIVEVDEDRLECDLPIYLKPSKIVGRHADVRLLATRKK